MTEYLYRAFGQVTQDVDGLEIVGVAEIIIDALPIIRRTPAGAWIAHPLTRAEKWVSAKGRKRFACPTKTEAVTSLIERNKRHLSHLYSATAKAKAIKECLALAAYTTVELSDGMFTIYPLRGEYYGR